MFSVCIEVGHRPTVSIHELAFHRNNRYFGVAADGDLKLAGHWDIKNGEVSTSHHNLLKPVLQKCYEAYINELIVGDRDE